MRKNRSFHRLIMALLLLGVALFAMVPLASASSVTITYYTIASNDPDANHLSFGTVDNEVQNHLGPNGLPILNTPAFGCTSNCFALNGPGFGTATSLDASGEITYWDPALNPYVTKTGTATVALPFSAPSNFFPPSGTGTQDGGPNGYQAAVLSGNLTVPANTTETISFNIGADDMAFAFLNGQVVCDLGGVHGSTAGTCTTAQVSSGTYPLEVFFVDINQVQSGLTFGLETSNIVTTPTTTPEPCTLVLLGSFLGIGGLLRRRK